MLSNDKKLIGAGLIVLAIVLIARKNAAGAALPFQRDPEAFGWGHYTRPDQNTGSGGLLTTGISYCADCGG